MSISKAWAMARLDECAEIISGATPDTDCPDYWGGEILWATPKDLSNLDQAILSDTPRKLTEAGLRSCSSRVLPINSVLFSSRAPIGLVAINSLPVATNQGFKSFIPDERKLHFGFLYWWLKANRKYLDGLGNGATFKEVSKSIISKVEIPLPPLPEQRRIAGILDKAETLRAKRRSALSKLDSLAQSIFLDMFGDPVANNKKWPLRSLDTVSVTIQIGPFGTQLHEADYIPNGTPLINPTHIKNGAIQPDMDLTVSDLKKDTISQYVLATGDVLLGRRGEMGRCAIVGEKENGWICGTGSLFIRPKTDLATSIYLFRVLSSESLKKKLEGISQGQTMANLNKTIVGSLLIALPPLPLQQAFARRIEAIQAMKERHRASLAKLDGLFASLQHRAFRGDL